MAVIAMCNCSKTTRHHGHTWTLRTPVLDGWRKIIKRQKYWCRGVA